MKCSSSNFEFKKWTDQNFITQNLRHVKDYRISKKKKLLKQCQKEVIYKHILAFAGWWVVMDIGGYILAGGGWWWVVVDIFWLVVGGGWWWWVVVDIFWLVVGGGG